LRARKGRVKLSGQTVGAIEEVGEEIRFAYSPEWLGKAGAVPVSLTMPLREQPYPSRVLHPFFENLLPEGWLLEVASKKLKISKDDAFGMLLATCSDCIGAVEIERMDDDEGTQ
jgi:serine/threonine-protein kinase HipA